MIPVLKSTGKGTSIPLRTFIPTITVKEERVVQRSFIAKRLVNGAGNQFETYEEWTKNLSSLGSHSSGSPLKTLDDIYREAENEWLLKRDNTTTSFHAANSGIISNCGYVENGCQDDCFRGISINAIEKI